MVIADFIGSNLLETLLKHVQKAFIFDNFEMVRRHSLDKVKELVEGVCWDNFVFIKGDIRNLEECRGTCENVQHVSRQSVPGLIPRSVKDPMNTNATNIYGFLNKLVAPCTRRKCETVCLCCSYSQMGISYVA